MTPVLLTGVPRSGTSWVGQVLTAHPSVFELYEPFNPGARDPLLLRYPSRLVTPESPLVVSDGLRRTVADMLALRLHPPRSLGPARPRRLAREARDAGRLLAAKFRRSTVVIKDPTARHLAAWLYRDFGVRPVVIIRHPCGNAAGFLRVGWSGVSRFLDSPGWAGQLRDEDREHVARHRSAARGDPVLSAALAWRVTNNLLLGLRGTIPQLVTVRYEDLVSDPHARFPALAADIGLPWGGANRRTLDDLHGPPLDEAALGSVPHVMKRDSAAAASSWRKRLSEADIDRVLEHAGPLARQLGYGR